MDAALIASAALLGLAGAPHCTAMCAAPCSAAIGRPGPGLGARSLSFHAARIGSYALAGALVSAAVGGLAAIASWAPALRPLWMLLHLAAFGLGLWLLWQGRQPAWLGAIGRMPAPAVAVQAQPMFATRMGTVAAGSGGAGGMHAGPAPAQRAAWPSVPGAQLSTVLGVASPWRAGGLGALWAAWPCGLLHSALLVAAMTNTAAGGAAAMAGFALASAAGLIWAPWLWSWVTRGSAGRGEGGRARRAEAWAARIAGGVLAAASGWALTHGMWHGIAVWCGLA
jgi:uncharacterized protein